MPQIAFKEKPLTFLLKERQATMQHMPPQSYLQLHVPLAWILPQCLSARTSAVITLWVSDHHTVVMKSSGELLSLLIDYISSWQLQWSSTRNDIPWIHKHPIHSSPSKSSFHSTSAFLPGIIQCLHRNLLWVPIWQARPHLHCNLLFNCICCLTSSMLAQKQCTQKYCHATHFLQYNIWS